MTDQGFGVVRPLPGDGLVACLGGLLLVCDAGEAAADDLLEALRSTAASGGDGRALARRAAQVLAANMTGDPATCAVAGPVGGGGVAVLVSGSAAAVITTADGDTRLAGSDSLTWADRLIAGPVERVELTLPGAGTPHPAVRFDGGVVHGGGLSGDFGDLGEQAAPAPARQLTSELPNTALHMEPDLIQPPAPERAPVNLPPYPMSGDQPPAAAPQGPGFQPGPPSGPQAAPSPEPAGTGASLGFPPPPAEQSPASPFQPLHEQPQPGGYPSYDEPAHTPNGAGEPYEQPGPPEPQPGPHLSAVPDYFEPAQPSGPPSGDHPDPYDQSGQPRYEQAGPPGFDQSGQPGYEQSGQPGYDQSGPPGYEQPGQPGPGQHGGQEQPEHGDRPLVYGVDCKNDHFNDPRSPYCAVCGIALVQRTLVPYKGPRPSLGVLVLDDGTTLPLESDYLLGRDPERAPEVAGGSARPAKVTSPDGSVSRRHLRVALDGWDVNLVDLGSVNGTQIQPPGDPNFYDIPPNEPVTIAPGTTVRVGVSRTMRFEPHRT
ncbi:FHA domain-containing protein [Nonomuraea rhodomycinica]|uniref:FHA domain-containing protein n=1 Tax=Nonomuraea rhodomycinica TaxID=1712872 RepID=A0A7Y6IQ01_9ACTN|nr:FHA domain-containing protein [Nonomuraea rhodomycinica]NUW41753.1 FHA domain-containing protein [Nonomuraea rhodomycinica]